MYYIRLYVNQRTELVVPTFLLHNRTVGFFSIDSTTYTTRNIDPTSPC